MSQYTALNIDADIENTVKQCGTCLEYQETQPHEKTILYELPHKPSEVVGADIFSVNNNTLLCVVDYYSKFPIVERVDGLSTDDLIKAAKIVFTEFGE